MVGAATDSRLSSTHILVRYLRPRAGGVVVLGLLLLAATALAVIGPQFLRGFIDQAEQAAPVSALLRAAVVFMAFALLADVLTMVADYQGARLAWAATNDLRTDLADHCMRLDMSFYQRQSSGELIERIDGDVGKLANFFSRMVLLIASNLLLLTGIGIALFLEDWRIGLCYVPFVLGSILLLRKLVGGAIPAAAAQRAATAKLLGFIEEHFGGLEDVRANGARGHVVRGFWRAGAVLLTAVRRAALLGVRWPAAAQSMASLGLVLSLIAGVMLYFAGQVSLGGAYLFVAYAGMLQMPLMIIVMQVHDMEQALGALRRIKELFGERSSVVDGPDRLPDRPAGTGTALELDAVSFAYQPGEFALRDVSLRLAPGERVVLVGRTGSGKSTLARLLLRFADPTSGRIMLDGKDMREVSVEDIRHHVGMVTQEVQIFHGTVRDNVTVFDQQVPDEDVTSALHQAGLGEWLAQLPDGLDTELGVGANGLSAGEEQLLAFARVLLTDPGLVVLDEASSRLDPRSKEVFDVAVDRLFTGRTAVVIAHQLDTVRSADQVVVLREGKVVEHGAPGVLLDDPGSELSRLWVAGEVPA